jgi:hypothetical protein
LQRGSEDVKKVKKILVQPAPGFSLVFCGKSDKNEAGLSRLLVLYLTFFHHAKAWRYFFSGSIEI